MVYYKIRDLIYKRRLEKIMDKWNQGEELTDTDKKNFYFAKGIQVREKILEEYVSMNNKGLIKRYIIKMDVALNTSANVYRTIKGLPPVQVA